MMVIRSITENVPFLQQRSWCLAPDIATLEVAVVSSAWPQLLFMSEKLILEIHYIHGSTQVESYWLIYPGILKFECLLPVVSIFYQIQDDVFRITSVIRYSRMESIFHWWYRTWLLMTKDSTNEINQLINQLVNAIDIHWAPPLGQTLCYVLG